MPVALPEPRTPGAALEAYIAATNTHRFEHVKELLHPQASFWFGDASCHSVDAAQLYFERAWRIVEDEQYRAHDVQWIATGTEVAVCTYTYHYQGSRDGSPVTGCGRATNVFVRTDARWALIHEHLSASPPPAAD